MATTAGAAVCISVIQPANLPATVVVLDRAAQDDDTVVAQAAELHGMGLRIRTLSLFYDEWVGELPHSELERVSLTFDIGEFAQRPLRPAQARDRRFYLGHQSLTFDLRILGRTLRLVLAVSGR